MSEILEISKYSKFEIAKDLYYFKPNTKKIKNTFGKEITSSLSSKNKWISSKFFYDEKGSELFEKICKLPEYYLTRTEIEILKNVCLDLGSHISKSRFRLVELGSGSSLKTRLILDVFDQTQQKTEYVPIDISEILIESLKILKNSYQNLSGIGIIDSYENGLDLIKEFDKNTKNLIIFLGSSFGNFDVSEGKDFLKLIHSMMDAEDLFLLGLDLHKDNLVLEKAYDDSEGITSEFNLNVLSRINRELGADFNLNKFAHHSFYNNNKNRVEMHIKSLEKQKISIDDLDLNLNFHKDETIRTEYSHKYTLSQIKEMFDDSGFKIKSKWMDKNNYFSIFLISKN